MIRDEIATLAEVLSWADSEAVHELIVSIYNQQPSRPRDYWLRYSDPWCAAFVSVLGIMLGLSGAVLPECSVPEMVKLYQQRGQWVEDDGYLPKKGDLLVYDWDDDGAGDCSGEGDHVGIVISRLGSSLLVVEGNRNDKVSMRTVNIDAQYIRGYCCPDYEDTAHKSVPQWAERELQAAIDAGITDGSRPMEYATRMEAAIMALRARRGDDDGR